MQDETAEERPGDRADGAPEIDVADRAAGLPRLLDGHLGDDRPDHPQHRRRDQEVEHDDQDGPQLPVDLVGRWEGGGRPRRSSRASTRVRNDPEGEQRPDGPARVDPVGQPAPQHVAQADPAQDDPDHARPDRQRRPDVPRDQPARDQLQDHDAQAAGKRQSIRQQSGARPDMNGTLPRSAASVGRRPKPFVGNRLKENRVHHIRREAVADNGAVSGAIRADLFRTGLLPSPSIPRRISGSPCRRTLRRSGSCHRS